MKSIRYIDRATGLEKKEKVYGDFFLRLLYSPHFLSRVFAQLILPLLTRFSFPSYLYGLLQKTPLSRFKIGRFIRKFQMDPTEFAEPITAYKSFNDFFIRKLKPACRPIRRDARQAILPADGRYLVFPHLDRVDGFFVKGKKFSLHSLLQDRALAEPFQGGTLVIARLAPVDYHRFHFCCEGIAHTPRSLPGPLYSVNPRALKQHPHILTSNKRMVTVVESSHFDTLLYVEVGATYVGTIHQTFTPDTFQKKGAEKGYFSFGGSCLLLLFKPGVIRLQADLVSASARSLEVLGKWGQPLGTSLKR